MNEVGAGVEINYGLDEQGRFTEDLSSGTPSLRRLHPGLAATEICSLWSEFHPTRAARARASRVVRRGDGRLARTQLVNCPSRLPWC